MNFTKTVAVGAFLATTLVAGSAFAKAHDQGLAPKPTAELADPAPGENVGSETVVPAQTLGAGQRNEQAPVKELREMAPGNSGTAGK